MQLMASDHDSFVRTEQQQKTVVLVCCGSARGNVIELTE